MSTGAILRRIAVYTAANLKDIFILALEERSTKEGALPGPGRAHHTHDRKGLGLRADNVQALLYELQLPGHVRRLLEEELRLHACRW